MRVSINLLVRRFDFWCNFGFGLRLSFRGVDGLSGFFGRPSGFNFILRFSNFGLLALGGLHSFFAQSLFLRLGSLSTSSKLVNPPSSIYKLLLASVERVALTTDINSYFCDCRCAFKSVPATKASDFCRY